MRYSEGFNCNHCGSVNIYIRNKEYRVYCCNGCGRIFSILKDTIYEYTPTYLQKWFYAIDIFLNTKKGISAKQLSVKL